MSRNLAYQLRALMPQRPLVIGTVQRIVSNIATVQLPDGTSLQARGSATIGMKVYVRDGAIEGEAPDLPLYAADV